MSKATDNCYIPFDEKSMQYKIESILDSKYCDHTETLYDFNEFDVPYQVALTYCPKCGKKNYGC